MKYFVSKLVDGLEYLLGLGGMKRDIVFLIISGAALLLSLFDAPLPFSAAWVAIILCGVPIVTEAFIGIITKFDIKADLLVSLALIASVIIGEDFAAGEVAFIMQLGSLLEELTVAKARAGIEKLVHLTPQKARLITPENEQIVPAEAVKVGDLLRVLPGETIPVDGVIISGHTSVNQAVMTGESLPVDKEPGDEVSSGTVNQFGAFDMRAAKVGEDSSIQRMIRLVQSADAGKAKIVGIADRWATWIVVIALTSAALTWFFTGEIIRAVTILVVFCPCALVLATPTAIMAAIGNATKHGFLVREGDALERLAAVTKITFDKTGTLTYGAPKVVHVESISADFTADDLYAVCAAAEQFSEHPLGKAVVRCFKSDVRAAIDPCEAFEMLPGRGVSASVNGHAVLAGSRELLAEHGAAVPEEAEAAVQTHLSQGHTIVYIAVDQKNGTASIKADSLTVSGDKSALNFDKGSSLTLANKTDSQTANTTLNGNVTIAGNATFTNQDINQTAGTFHVGTLNASNSKLTFNTTEENGVTVGTLTGDLKLEAGASVTEKLGSAEKVAGALDSIIGGGAASTLKHNFVGGEASDMTGAWTYDAATGDVSYQGSRLSPTLTAVTHANAANLAQWRYEVNHLSERLGDVRSQNGALGAWARVYGTDAKVSDSVSTKFTNNTIQVGGDAKVGDTWIVGAAFGYTDNSTDFSNGSADSDGYTLSVYGTAVLPSGSYLDLIGRVGRISTDIDVSTVTPFKASYDNTTVGLSAEVGHRFDLSQIFYVTPQAELAYGRVFGDDYSGSNGMKVSQDDFDTLIARIGFQAGANFADNRGSIYLTASVNHDFLGDTEATASKAGAQDQKLKEDLGGTWFSYGIGAQFSTTNNLSFYGSLTRANGSDYQEDYHYSVGARYVF